MAGRTRWRSILSAASRPTVDGAFRAQRPPIESSDFEATAITLRALLAFAPMPKAAEYAKAIERGAEWLVRTQPKTNEDYVYRLLGMSWTGRSKKVIRKAARELIELQRQDGGWAQLSALPSDPYATGQALTALAEARGAAVDDPVYQSGLKFLIDTQLEDGSWFVRPVRFRCSPTSMQEFPHESNQFISDAATNWAIMALVHATNDKKTPNIRLRLAFQKFLRDSEFQISIGSTALAICHAGFGVDRPPLEHALGNGSISKVTSTRSGKGLLKNLQTTHAAGRPPKPT